ncbi:MAG TPA: NAD(P)H-dependent oxidoreductase subunit E [Candidatus Acidoferrales bacterium]|nr:NAD(P)H-dependent oxidoreductase subunit E [Candidatus Acidoferrales bacterium]
MDLHFTSERASDSERIAVDAVLGAPRSAWDGGIRSARDGHVAIGGDAARAQRHRLLPALHALNDSVGWISPGALNYVCERLRVPPAEAYGVASFYGLFATTARPRAMLHVCDDIACKLAGADQLCATLEKAASGGSNATAGWARSPCLGLCDRAPAALYLEAHATAPRAITFTQATASALEAALLATPAKPSFVPAVVVGQPRKLLRRVGVVDPASIADYQGAGGFAALRRAIAMGPERIVLEVETSKLAGRGGAAFPTARKWRAVADEPIHPHYMICNADESEPGTFKDRVLMEEDPFAVVEAMTIAATAGGCERGYLYIRGEYPAAAQRMQHAIDAARDAGMLGDAVCGSDVRFDIELRRGAGAYICGEETALFNSIEGKRGEPRNKPPFPVRRGLFGKPTIVNNVETLANVLDIVVEGGEAFSHVGTPGSTGTKLFCLCGHVARPGLYEVPLGKRLSALIDLAGGVRDGKGLQAVLLGGAAGAFVTPSEIDVALSFEGVREIGATLGSGVVMVMDETADLAGVLLRIAAFFRDESCGQCVPCRVGTARQEELLHRLQRRRQQGLVAEDRELLAQIGQVMRDASICGLGQTASSAIESALRKFEVFSHA